MAVQNRPVVGYIKCDGCGERATVHQAQRASKKGLLYTRCDNCGCDQRTGKAVQNRIQQQIEPRPGFEGLKIAVEELVKEPKQTATAGPATEPDTTEPNTKPIPDTVPKGNKTTLKTPVFAGLLAVGITLITLGATIK